MDDEYLNLYKDILKNKREAKVLRKIHNEMFDIYVSKLGPLDLPTAKAYCKMLSQFITYSPSVDPNDLEHFLPNKFNLNKKSGTFKSNLKRTSLKYNNCINRFLKIIYSTEYSKLDPQYAATITEIFKEKNSSASVSDVFNVYYQLTELKKFEDTLMIHLIYSLKVNPETLSINFWCYWWERKYDVLWYSKMRLCNGQSEWESNKRHQSL